MKMFRSKVAKTARDYSDELHERYMEADRYDYRTGNYKDLLSEVIDIMDTLEFQARKKWWKK